MDFPEQQQQTQYLYHHQHPPSSSTYDPSQSYEAYYAYHHHHQCYDPSSYPHQVDYDNSSTQAYPLPTQIHHHPEKQPPAANSAAAAAMTALSQFVGDMDAAEKAGMTYNPHHYPQHYPMQHYPMEHGYVSIQPGGSGGGRRGGGTFRDGGTRGGAGRGRGRAGGRKPHQSAPNSAPTSTAAVPTPVPPVPPVPVLPVAWCDICRVECTSLEILEQHKNGKRHKKTAQRFEEIQKKQKLLAEYQAKSIPNVILPRVVTENAAEVVEAKKVSAEPEIIPTAAGFSTRVGEPAKASATDDRNAAGISSLVGEETKASATDDNNAQVDGASKTNNPETEQISESKGTGIEGSMGPPGSKGDNRFKRKRGGGMKWKITRYGRLNSFELVPRRVSERQRVCTLCNVKCETLVVFESHIAGKKHISKIKRCQGPGAVYGPITVDIPPNQPSAYPAQGQEPLIYGLQSHEMTQQATCIQGLQNNAEGGVSEQEMRGVETERGKEVTAIDNTDPQDPANAPLVFESKKPNPSTGVPKEN